MLLAWLGCLLGTYRSCAQAVPDTSLNNIIRADSLKQATRDTVGAAEESTTPPVADTVAIKKGPYQPNPKKAGLYSSIVPGLGQLYNHEYWKVPLVYGGLAVAGYFFVDNLNNYQSYYKAYIGRINNPHPTDPYVKYVNGVAAYTYTTDQLNQLQNDYNRYLDMTVLFSTIGYALQVLDAITSAHLKNFDISRDISMHVLPVPVPNGAGLGLVVNFK